MKRFEFKFLFWSVVLAVAVTLFSALLAPYFDLSKNPFIQKIVGVKEEALAFYFLYSAFAAILIPVPTMPLEILFAGLFGIPITLAVRLAGSLLGATAAFLLAQKYGRPLLQRLLPASAYNEIDKFSGAKGLKAFFLISIFPFVNPEVMAYVAGLGNLKLIPTLLVLVVANFYRFFIVMVWGRQILANLGI